MKAGGESSIDMRLRGQTQTFHVRGRAINPNGGPIPEGTTVGLGNNLLSGFSTSRSPEDSFDPATGMFDIANVPPGDFHVVVQQRATPLAASVPIRVTNADINGLAIMLTGVTVPGKLIVEGQAISTVPNLEQLRLDVRNLVLTGPARPVPTTIDANGNFDVAGMREEEYRAQMSMIVPGFYVRSIKYGGDDILGRTFRFSSRRPEQFEVVLKAGTQTIAGTVTDAQSQPVPGVAVVFIPAQRGRADLFRSTYTDQTGKFTMTNLAPGDYEVLSWEAMDTNAYRDPDFLKQYERLGKAISVTEFSNSSVEVKLIPAR